MASVGQPVIEWILQNQKKGERKKASAEATSLSILETGWQLPALVRSPVAAAQYVTTNPRKVTKARKWNSNHPDWKEEAVTVNSQVMGSHR